MKVSFSSISLVSCLLFLWVGCSKPTTDSNVASSETVDNGPQLQSSVRTEQELRRDARETKKRVDSLAKMEAYKKQRSDALKKSPTIRQHIFYSKSDEWNHILEKHDSEYQQLKILAEQAEHRMVDCTICEGDTYLDYCIFCEENSNGKCSECEGSGGRVIGEVCSACLGTGECFMCSGTKMMMCLFCDDGSVDLALPPHHETVGFD